MHAIQTAKGTTLNLSLSDEQPLHVQLLLIPHAMELQLGTRAVLAALSIESYLALQEEQSRFPTLPFLNLPTLTADKQNSLSLDSATTMAMLDAEHQDAEGFRVESVKNGSGRSTSVVCLAVSIGSAKFSKWSLTPEQLNNTWHMLTLTCYKKAKSEVIEEEIDDTQIFVTDAPASLLKHMIPTILALLKPNATVLPPPP